MQDGTSNSATLNTPNSCEADDTSSLINQLKQQRDEARSSLAECQEQLQEFMRAIELVSKLAAMDSNTYHTSQTGCPVNHSQQRKLASNDKNSSESIVIKSNVSDLPNVDGLAIKENFPSNNSHRNSLPPLLKNLNKEQNSNAPKCKQNLNEGDIGNTTNTESTIHLELDSVLQKWKLEETPLLNVIASIHRLQSHLLHSQTEADALMPQVHSLHQVLIKYKMRNTKLEKAVKKLYKNNIRLVTYLKDKEREHKDFVKSSEDVQRKRAESENMDKEQLQVTNQILIHEKIMQMGYVRSNHKNVIDGYSGTIPQHKRDDEEQDYDDINDDLSYASSEMSNENYSISTDTVGYDHQSVQTNEDFDEQSYLSKDVPTEISEDNSSRRKTGTFLNWRRKLKKSPKTVLPPAEERSRSRISSSSTLSTVPSSIMSKSVVPEETIDSDSESKMTQQTTDRTTVRTRRTSSKKRTDKSFMDVCKFMSTSHKKKNLTKTKKSKRPPLINNLVSCEQ